MRRHLTFSNTIACLALFIALGGISWAAATAPKNSVANKSIKNKAVTNAKIRNSAVTSSKIKTGQVFSGDVRDNTLMGVDVNEGSLDTVPSATTASTASTAADQINVFRSVTSSASNSDPNIARNQATEIPLGSHGAVSVYAKCFHDSDINNVFGVVYVRTTANGATLIGNTVLDSYYGGPSLNTGTLEVDREASYQGQTPNALNFQLTGSASLVGPDGLGISFDVTTVLRSGSPADAPGYLQSTSSCAFHMNGSKVG